MKKLTDFQFSELPLPVRFGAQHHIFEKHQNTIRELLEKYGFKYAQNINEKFWTYSLFDGSNAKLTYKELKKIVKKTLSGAEVDFDCAAFDKIDQTIFNPAPTDENPSVFDCVSILIFG